MPALDERTLRVSGLRELQRAFAVADRELSHELTGRLRKVAEPVASDAERLAVQKIRNIGNRWSAMRVGVTRSLVYVAPKQRGVKSRRNRALRRPNLAGLLMDKAMSPALDLNQGRIVHEAENLLDEIGRDWERA
jgi:hypothetical protein